MKQIQILLAIILTLGLLGVSSAVAAIGQDARTANKFTSPTFTPSPIQPASTAVDASTPARPPLSLTITLLCFCLMFLVIIGILVLGVILRNQNMKEMNKDQP